MQRRCVRRVKARVTMHRAIVGALLGLLGLAATAQSDGKPFDGKTPDARPPDDDSTFSPACRQSVLSMLQTRNAIGDHAFKPGLVVVPKVLAERVLQSGLHRGSLEVLSFVRPPSAYELVQYAETGVLKSPGSCPLDQTYLLFSLGGLRQETFVFGPLK